MADFLVNPAVQSNYASKVAAASLTFTTAGVGAAGTLQGILSTASTPAPGGMVILRDLIIYCTSTLIFGAFGTATGVNATTMTDGGASWTVNWFAGATVTMGGKTATIISNTNTVLTFASWVGGTPTAGAYTITGAAGTGTLLSLGVETSPYNQFIANTDATLITQYTFWHSTAPSTTPVVTPSAARNFPLYYLSTGAIVCCTPTVHDIVGGTLVVYALYDSVVPGSYLTTTGSSVAV